MCMFIDQDTEEFKHAISARERAYERNAPVQHERMLVCEKSRFVWLSTRDAASLYPGVLEQYGTGIDSSRAHEIGTLFETAIRLLQRENDDYLATVVERYNDLRPSIEAA